MFTGIVEEIGYIKSFKTGINGANIEISCSKILEDAKLGDSICVNGVCQTIIDLTENSFKANISQETLNITTLKHCKTKEEVNLERALTLNTRLGGHIVSGHVDCIGKLLDITQLSDYYNLTFEIPNEFAKYIIYKGSITINGISLTVAKITDNKFSVAIIPHTFNNTMLKTLKIGESVNIETDILGKYVEKMLSAQNSNNSKIDMNFLSQNGFL